MIRSLLLRFWGVRLADPVALNTYIGAYTAVWGVWLLLPSDSYSLPIYREFARAGIPESFLGAVLVVLGAFLLVATLAGSPTWRRVALLQHAALWSFLAVFFLRGAPLAFAGVSSLLFAAQSLWSYWVIRYRTMVSHVGPA